MENKNILMIELKKTIMALASTLKIGNFVRLRRNLFRLRKDNFWYFVKYQKYIFLPCGAKKSHPTPFAKAVQCWAVRCDSPASPNINSSPPNQIYFMNWLSRIYRGPRLQRH